MFNSSQREGLHVWAEIKYLHLNLAQKEMIQYVFSSFSFSVCNGIYSMEIEGKRRVNLKIPSSVPQHEKQALCK